MLSAMKLNKIVLPSVLRRQCWEAQGKTWVARDSLIIMVGHDVLSVLRQVCMEWPLKKKTFMEFYYQSSRKLW